MIKIGIIAEFNPFHNGHLYFINKIKEMYPESFITLVMSTNFTQRGEFSFLTKWDKTRISLNNNIDLVIELAFYFATQSSDTFAKTAVSILEYLDMDYLIFGSESNDIKTLTTLASTAIFNKEYDKLVKEYLKTGNSYPSSVSKALFNLTNINLIDSNDILGVSYIKAILLNDYKIKPLCIKRTNSYLNKQTTGTISSATSIRELFINNKDYKDFIPNDTYKLMNIDKNYINNYFNILKYKLISEIDELDIYLDVNEGIDKKIKKVILNVTSYQELLNKLKSKRYTYNKLNRMFLHILLNIKKSDSYDIKYIRVLGFNEMGRKYIKKMKEEITLPIITNYRETTDLVLDIEKIATILYLNITNRSHLIKEELMSAPISKN
ncbi:MAG: nucleotidyltransferase [Bacilli bacterium]|nr:nucleotidyltransferase [Bacilli bacterium]